MLSLLFKEEEYERRGPRVNTNMISNFMSNRHPNISFNILFYPQYQDEHGQVMCHPGSVFEGVIQIKVTESMPVHHIKLVFKASGKIEYKTGFLTVILISSLERVNYDAMGWEKSKEDDNRLFAVRTIIWGLPSDEHLPESSWPVLTAGEHNFPFVLQMPVVNFPPTFQHHLIATAFNLFVSVQKAGENVPICSKPWPIAFRPIVETIPVKNLHAFTEETKLTNTITAMVSVPRLAYNIHDKHQFIPVTVRFHADKQQEPIHISQLRTYVKRYYGISYKTFSRNEATIITQYDHPKLPTTCPSTITMKLRIPEESDLPATLTYSPHLKVGYKLVVCAKMRHGPIHIKKKLFEMPIIFGTLPAGTRAPRQLEPYSKLVENRSIILSKPVFLRSDHAEQDEQENLPAYDSGDMPPVYSNSISSAVIAT